MTTTANDTGHTQVSNELFDSILRYPFSKRQQGILLAVVRQTSGYNKDEDDVSGKRLEQLTGMKATHCLAALRELDELKVINRRPGRFGQVVSINQNYHLWGMTETVNPQTKTVTDIDRIGHSRQTKTVRGCDRNGQQQKTTKQNTTSKDNHNKGGDRIGHSEWTLPNGVDRQAWDEFESHRCEIRKPLTDLARTKNVNVLVGFEPDVQQVIVDTTIANRWTGLFPPKGKGAGGHQESFTEQRVGNTTGNLIEIFGEHDHGQDHIPGEHAVPGCSLRRGDHEATGKRVLAPAGRAAR